MNGSVTLFVPGEPIPQGSVTPMRNRKTGAMFVKYAPAVVNWRSVVTGAAIEAQAEWMHTHPEIEFPITGAVGVRLTFLLPRPKTQFGSGKNASRILPSAPQRPDRMPDLDKLVRAILDALTDARVWNDDGQVVTAVCHKVYAGEGQRPGVEITLGAI